MSGEQWGEAVDAAAAAFQAAMEKHHDEAAHMMLAQAAGTANPAYTYGFGLHMRNAVADAVVNAAAPLIVADTRRKVAEEITDNVRNADFAKQDRGGYHGFTECMAYVAGHDKAATIARGSGNGDSGQEAT